MRVHNNTIRKYVQALLDILNDFQVQYIRTDGKIVNKKVPIVYSNREKSQMVDFVSQNFLETGNYSVLPRSYIKLVQLQKSEERLTNKLIKTNINIKGDYQEFVFNPTPYEFVFEYTIHCRGMNEASQLIEQIQTKFNPSVEMDIWDQQNQTSPTRVPVRLLDIGIDSEDYTEESTNIFTITCSLQLNGNMYSPNNLDDKFSDPELTPCDDGECGECSECQELPMVNIRTMPVIKQVGYSLRSSSDPKNKITDDIIRLEMFDVDDKGYLVCPDRSIPYNFSKAFNEVLKDSQELMNEKSILDSMNTEEPGFQERFNQFLTQIQDSLISFKKKIFEIKNSITKDTPEDISEKQENLHKIIWGYEQVIVKIEKINTLLKD